MTDFKKEDNMKIDCNSCKYINITEYEQTDKKEHHICLKYNIRIFHNIFTVYRRGIHDSKLYPCIECKKDNYKCYSNRYFR